MFNLEFACSNAMARVRGAIAQDVFIHRSELAGAEPFVHALREIEFFPCSFSEVTYHPIQCAEPVIVVKGRDTVRVVLAWWADLRKGDIVQIADFVTRWEVVEIRHDASTGYELVATLHSLPRGAAGVQPLE